MLEGEEPAGWAVEIFLAGICCESVEVFLEDENPGGMNS